MSFWFLKVSLYELQRHSTMRLNVNFMCFSHFQIVPLTDVVRCHSDAVPHYVTFTLRPKLQDNLTESHQFERKVSLEAAVSIKQVSPKKSVKGVTVDIALNLDGNEELEHDRSGGMLCLFVVEVVLLVGPSLSVTSRRPTSIKPY